MQKHLFHKQRLSHLAKLIKWSSWVESSYWYGAFDSLFLSCHVRVSEWIHTLSFQECQRTPCSKQVRYLIFQWPQRDSNSHQLVHKLTLNHSAKLTKWLSWVVSSYLYSAFDYMFLSCDVGVSQWIHDLYLPEFQGTPCPEKSQFLEFNWAQRDSNPQPLSS